MKRKRYTEEQVINILKEHETSPRPLSCRAASHGVSEQSIYRWKAKHGGVESSDSKRLKELEEENRRLKRMVADLRLKVRCGPSHEL